MLLSNLDLLATAPRGVARLRELILTLAVQGKLVPQDPADEPAIVLLQKIRGEKDRLIADGNIKRDKPLPPITDEEKPFELPVGWEWVRWANIALKIGDIDHKMPSEVKNGVPYVSPRDFYGNNDIDFDGAKRIAYSDYVELASKIRPELGDLIYPRYGTIGVVRKVTTEREFLASYSCAVIKVLCGFIEPEYQYLFSVSGCAKAQAASATNTTTQPNVGLKSIQEFLVPLPPLAEQSRIVARVKELMRLCDALEVKGKLEAAQHAQLVSTMLDTLTASATPEELSYNWQRVAQHFDLLLDRPEAIDALEQTLLQLAVRGLLVPQDPTDEPASTLLARIRTEKDRLIAEGKIKRDKPLPPITDEDKPFELPVGWEWVRFDELIHPLKPIAYGVLVPGPDVATGVPFARIADLSLMDPPEKPEKTISPEVDAQFRRTRLDGGEILMGVVGSIGKLGVAPKTWAGANIARAICRIVPADAGLHNFVLFLLQTKFMQDSFAGETRTLAQPTLNVGLIRAALTPMPPPVEQSRIVARITALRRLCADLRQRLAARQSVQARLAEALVDSASI